MERNAATEAQIDAAQPDRSTWLSANAGSGKTRVLTDRVARLLLEQVDPQNILCLTYTKAAASEMQNRLFGNLGRWAMLPDASLRQELWTLGIESELSADTLCHARRLFAMAIETPGGLKIQTIHSFCASLLRRFPLEAGVTPQFKEMDERSAALLRGEIVEEIAAGETAQTLHAAARHYGGDSFEELTREIARNRACFTVPLSDEALETLFGYPPGLTLDEIARGVFAGGETALFARLIPALMQSGSNDQKLGAVLSGLKPGESGALAALEGVFLLKSGDNAFCAKLPGITTQPVPTKGFRAAHADLIPPLDDLMRRVEAARAPRLAVQAMARTRALHDFAAQFLPAYATAKQARGWLDFDDLILRARDLLTDPLVAEWVLFRLDGGIDHILVDEAQDTSPVQWQVIERLAQEFTSGEGAQADKRRTIFVVGDKKQSIYSFQGADPREFDRMQREFGTRLAQSGAPLNAMELQYSFRSSHAILTLVDHTFSRSAQSGFAPDVTHKAFKADMPGRVDLWPVVPKPEKEDKPDWHQPVDVKAANDPSVILARQVARRIRAMIDDQTSLPHRPGDGGPYRWRAVQPGDILILVQRRSELFHEIIRECKAQGLPIAGADRLKVGAELAVRDLAALLSFLATPEDSLSLATALKSPLFGWDEAQLYDLAHGRHQTYLWAELRDRAADFPETVEILRALLKQADFLRPYDLIERILTRHNGRRLLLSRLGPEAEDGIDALLAQAMTYEQMEIDSLTGFLIWMETDDLEIKRQMDSAGNRIRVMTVHGAKGLEAPIVILPDTAKRIPRNDSQILLSDEWPLWRTMADSTPEVIARAAEEVRSAQDAERDRLLYVAMTRAENWLIVAAAGDVKDQDDSWYSKIKQGMHEAGAMPCCFDGQRGLQLFHGEWAETEPDSTVSELPELPDLPGFFRFPAPQAAGPPATLSPSDLGGAKALAGEAGQDEEAAKLWGRRIHRLLEHLPSAVPDTWPSMARRILGQGPEAADEETIKACLAEVSGVLGNPDLRRLFTGDTLSEVPITATLGSLQGRRIHGVIDRLVIEPTRVLAVDFKSNAIVPDTVDACPEGLLRQMGAYAHALQSLYPEHEVETALLWTKPARLMMLPHDLVTHALDTTQIS